NGMECPGEIRIPLRVSLHWCRGENGLILLARIANQRALDLINPARSAGGIATIQHESINIEGNMSGRQIDAGPSAQRAPRSGPGVDSPNRIVIGNGDIADDCFPSNDCVVVIGKCPNGTTKYSKQSQRLLHVLHVNLVLSF